MPIILAPLLLPAAVFFAAIVLYALSQSSQGWADPTIKAAKARNQSQLNRWITHYVELGFVWDRLGALVTQGVKFVRTHVSHWAEAHLRPVTAWFGALNQLAYGLFVGIGALAGDVADEFERLLNFDLPHVLRRAEAFARHGIDALAHDLHRELARLRGYAVGIDRLARHTILPQLHRLERTVDHAIPRELGRIRTRERALERRFRGIEAGVRELDRGAIRPFRWLITHRNSAAMGVFSTAVTLALGRFGLGFIRCRGWQQAFRRVTCGMSGILEDLLAVAFEVMALRDACAVVGAVEAAAIRLEPVLTAFVLEAEGFVCGGVQAYPSGIVASDVQRVAALPSGVIVGVDV